MLDKHKLQFKIRELKDKLSLEEREYLFKLIVDEKRQHGKWKRYPAAFECSLCKYLIDIESDDIQLEPRRLQLYRFCPRCGGIMDGE